MTDKDKQPKSRKSKKPDAVRPMPGVFAEVSCRRISYEFELSLADFDAKKFLRVKSIAAGDRWSAVVYSKRRETGYHIHVAGSVEEKVIQLRIDYYSGAHHTASSKSEPTAELFMKTVGACFKKPSARATRSALFEKPLGLWRSRFNLPFKVTMGEKEVVIDGISVVMPKNTSNVTSGFIARAQPAEYIFLILEGNANVGFADFDVEADLRTVDDVTRLVLEEVR